MAKTQNEAESAVLSVDEVAKVLQLSRESAYLGCQTGDIPNVRIGRRILIPRRAIEKMLEGNGQAGTIPS